MGVMAKTSPTLLSLSKSFIEDSLFSGKSRTGEKKKVKIFNSFFSINFISEAIS